MPRNDKDLRNHLIRLAHQHPEFRNDLLPLIKSAASEFDPESIGEQVSGPEGVPGSDAQKPWAKDEFTQVENVELFEKQEDGDLSDGQADPVGKSANDFAKKAFRMARMAGKSQEDALAFAKRASAVKKKSIVKPDSA